METISKTTFALFFGNRGFFPASLIAQARNEIQTRLEQMGHKVLMLEESATIAHISDDKQWFILRAGIQAEQAVVGV